MESDVTSAEMELIGYGEEKRHDSLKRSYPQLSTEDIETTGFRIKNKYGE